MEIENNLRSEIAARSNRPARRRRDVAKQPAGLRHFENWDFGFLSMQGWRLYRTVVWVAAVYAVGGTTFLSLAHPANALAFAIVAAAGWLGLEFWLRAGRLGVPALAVLAAITTVLNSLPLLTGNESLEGVADFTVVASVLSVAFYLAVLCGGWWLGTRSVNRQISAWNLLPPGASLAGGVGLALSLPLLGLLVLFQIGTISGVVYQLLPGSLAGFFQVLQTFAGAGAMLGAFLGGLAVAQQPFSTSSLIFWVLFAVAFLLLTASILLSAASGIVIACAVGLGFRRQRIPWEFLVTMLLLVGFLNQGKFVMRDRYWSQGSGQTVATLGQLPEFYAEWAETSLVALANNWHAGDTGPRLNEKEGQSMVDRLDNFNNLTFIVDILQRQTMTPIYGESYTLIPKLLIPRFMWPDKPRSHEGQILLNLHFGRQSSVDETYNTYIAWGLLPEAVGNFGCVGGPIFLGLLAGFFCGWLESWSARKLVLSVEGLAVIALLVALATSYEMVASVFVTAVFQMLVAVYTLGFLLRFWFYKTPSATALRRIHRQEQAKSKSLQTINLKS